MKPSELLEVLKARGISLSLSPLGNLILDGPEEALTEALVQTVSAYKRILVDILQKEAEKKGAQHGVVGRSPVPAQKGQEGHEPG